MQIKLLCSLILSLAIAATGFSQTVSIMPRRVIYARKFTVPFSGKKAFAVTYPVISGTIPLAIKKVKEQHRERFKKEARIVGGEPVEAAHF